MSPLLNQFEPDQFLENCKNCRYKRHPEVCIECVYRTSDAFEKRND